MGHSNLSCAMTGQSLSETEVVLFPLLRQKRSNPGGSFVYGTDNEYKLLTLPIFGHLGSYTNFTPELDFNTQFISDFLNVRISQFTDQVIDQYLSRDGGVLRHVFELNKMKSRLSSYAEETDHVINGCVVAREAWDSFINYGRDANKFTETCIHYLYGSLNSLGFQDIYIKKEEKDCIGSRSDNVHIKIQSDSVFLVFQDNDNNYYVMKRGDNSSKRKMNNKHSTKIGELIDFLKRYGVLFSIEEEIDFEKSYMFNYVKNDFFRKFTNGSYNVIVDNINKYKTDAGYVFTFPTENYLNVDNGRFVLEFSNNENELLFNRKFRFMHDEEFELIKDNIQKYEACDLLFASLTDFEELYKFSEIEKMPIDKKLFQLIRKTTGPKNSRVELVSGEFSLFYTEAEKVAKDEFCQRMSETLIFESNMNVLCKKFCPTNVGIQGGCKKTQKEMIKVINKILKK